MRALLALFTVLAATATVVLVAVGCQTYDFEPVVPLAIAQKTDTETITAVNLKPTLMMVVDKSGSMYAPIDPADSRCTPAGCGTVSNPCAAGCPTRISELRSAMNTFLSGSGTVARMGLTAYPYTAGGDACGAPTEADILVPMAGADDDATLQSTASTIDGQIQALAPGGGTPTGTTLAGLQNYTPLKDSQRSNFVLLLTDGEPNCNRNNPIDCTDPVACKCTVGPSCGLPDGGGANCRIGCLDQDGTVAAITQLRSAGIKTIVVGFGAELASGNAPAVLTAMAMAGGFARTCPNGTDAECGTGDTCNTLTRQCNRPYYQSSNGAELAAALAEIGAGIVDDNPCEHLLSVRPADPRFLSVIVNDTPTPSGDQTWHYDELSNKVIFTGALCTQLMSSTSSNPVKVEYRIVTSL